MKALTVKQPWAWAIIHGGKDVENRSRKTNYRGKLCIHAGLGYSPEAEGEEVMQTAWRGEAQVAVERDNMGPLRKQDLFLEYGHVIGTIDVVGCHHADDCIGIDAGCSKWAQPYAYH